MDNNFKESTIEALILASPDPLPARKIAEMVDGYSPSKVNQAVASLNNRYMEGGNSFRIREVAGGYQVYIVPEFTGYVQEMFSRRRKMRLTRAALETLAIVAYRQPVTRVDIEQIRGVASDGVIHNLLEKSMITIKGRASTVGKPLQYGTTDEFLKFFGLSSLNDLPKMSEIEELVASEAAKSEPELELEGEKDDGDGNGNGNGNGHGDQPIKLNLADGTFDPMRRINVEDLAEGAKVVVNSKESDGVVDKEPIAQEEASDEAAESNSGIIIDIDTT